MFRNLLPALALGALLALAGCAAQPQVVPGLASASPGAVTASAPVPSEEDAFYADVMDTPGLTSTVARGDLVTVGQNICTVIGSPGVTRDATLATLGTSKWGPAVMEVVMDAANRNLCPEKSFASAVAATPAPAPASTAPASISDGTYEVGTDIEPGKYKTTGPTDTRYWPMCYWARLKNTDGDLNSIIANDNIKGQTTVTIKASDGAFETNGCAPWVKVG